MLARIALIFIALYKKIMHGAAKNCRYYPTCSAYGDESIRRHGAAGIILALLRIIRCNQFFKGGYDPVK